MKIFHTGRFYRLMLGIWAFGRLSLLAQQPIDLPPVSNKDLQNNAYPNFPDAEAVVLHDEGYYIFGEHAGEYATLMHRVVRIKILNEKGLSFGEVQEYFYHKNDTEYIRDIEALTYNLEGGMVEVSKLDKNQIFYEKHNDNVSKVKFSCPRVKPGSIVEYSYTKISKSIFSVDPWYFQSEIPTLVSRCKISVYRTLEYTWVYLGTMKEKLKQLDPVYWEMKDVPALKEEAYISTIDDYRQRIFFQLSAYVGNSGPVKTNQTWDQLNQELISDASIGQNLRKSKKMEEIALAICKGESDPLRKMKLIYEYVQKNISWNGIRTYFTLDKVEKVLETKKGNSAGINLLLIQLLQEAGLDAHPVVLSTRDHGKMIKSYPIALQLNQLIAYVNVSEKVYFLNASHSFTEAGMLDLDDLNEEGWLLHPKQGRWVKIPSGVPSSSSVTCNLTFDDELQCKGFVQERYTGYEAFMRRREIKNKGQETYVKDRIASKISEGKVGYATIFSQDSVEKPLRIKYSLESGQGISEAGDKVYISPFLFYKSESNPFLSPERTYPVDFNYTQSHQLIYTLEIPDSYTFESMPENKIVRFPDNTARLTFSTQAMGNKITVVEKLEILREVFQPEEYANLKVIFDWLLKKEGEMIVLKKKT